VCYENSGWLDHEVSPGLTRNCLDGSKHAGELIVTGLVHPILGYIEGVIVIILLHYIAGLGVYQVCSSDRSWVVVGGGWVTKKYKQRKMEK